MLQKQQLGHYITWLVMNQVHSVFYIVLGIHYIFFAVWCIKKLYLTPIKEVFCVYFLYYVTSSTTSTKSKWLHKLSLSGVLKLALCNDFADFSILKLAYAMMLKYSKSSHSVENCSYKTLHYAKQHYERGMLIV